MSFYVVWNNTPWKIHVFFHNCIILNIHKICGKSNQNYLICLQWMLLSKFCGICFKMLLICIPFIESIIYKWLLISFFLLINIQNFLYFILPPSFNFPSSITFFFLPTSSYKPLFKIFETLNLSNPKTLSFIVFYVNFPFYLSNFRTHPFYACWQL
jgi:hypothetical protein